MVRFGLCCIFKEEPVRFRTVTAKTLYALPRKLRRKLRMGRVSKVCLHNTESLYNALQVVNRLGIKAFRILSQLFPRYTHPDVGYTIDILPDAERIQATLRRISAFRKSHDIRLSFHPDQFVVLNSPREDVVERSIAEIEYQAIVAQAVGAEVINIHVGGVYGCKAESIKRFARNFGRLSRQARKRVTLENDDSLFTPTDILPLCNDLGVPFVYDVHHHRCNPDRLSIEEATVLAMETWVPRRREPHFHISSPKYGWEGCDPKPHSDYINPVDIPDAWRHISRFTLDVEAKAKEKAVLKLRSEWPFGHVSCG